VAGKHETVTVPGVGVPWTSVDPAQGTVLAGARSDLVLTPLGRLCPILQQPQAFTLTISLASGGASSLTITDTIAPAPRIAVLATPSETQWSCASGQQQSAFTVTLDNTGSTVDVPWQVGKVDLSPRSVPWASVSPESGTLPSGATQTISITPDASECDLPEGTQDTYTPTLSYGSGGTLTLANTVTQPIP
jgi:hypothetical protein